MMEVTLGALGREYGWGFAVVAEVCYKRDKA